MVKAFVICPYTLIDILDKKSEWNAKGNPNTRYFLDLLAREKAGVCTLRSKRYRGFMPAIVHDLLTEIILVALSKTVKKKTFLKKYEILATLHSAFERNETVSKGTPFEAVLETCREPDDEHDVYLISHYKGDIIKAQGSLSKKTNNDFDYGKFEILDIKGVTALMGFQQLKK